MMNFEYSDENKIKINPDDETPPEDQDAPEIPRENPLAEEESVEENDFGHE